MVAASDTLPVPSKLITDATTSPVISKFLAVSNAVAVPALPVKFPENVVAVIAPETFTSSNSVCPSTSISPLKSAAPVKVESPAIESANPTILSADTDDPVNSPNTLLYNLVAVTNPEI